MSARKIGPGWAVAFALLASPSFAQTGNGGSAAAKPKNDAPAPQHLLGDWGGLRTDLAARGIDLSVGYIGQFAANIAGGKDTGGDYAQQLEFKLDLDWEKLARLAGFSTHAFFVNRLGRNTSADYVGDRIAQVQSVYGGGGNVILHLAELYAGAADIAAGRLLVGEDYATSPLYCGFMTTMVCGYPNSLASKAGFTVFPNSTWGARLRLSSGHLYAQAGAYQVRPQNGGRAGFDWGWSGTTGTYYPIEAGYEPVFGADALEGHYKFGFAHDTSPYPDLYRDVNGAAFATTGLLPFEHSGRSSAYVLVDQMLIRNGDGGGNGLVLFGGYVWSDPRIAQFSRFAFAGLTEQALFPSRPDDSAGVVVGWQHVSGDLSATQAIQAANGAPLSLAASGVQSDETVIETRYSIAVAKGLSIMPDLQYVIHPDAARTYADALVAAQIKADF